MSAYIYNPNLTLNTNLHRAIEIGDLEATVDLIEQGADINSPTKDQNTALMLLVIKGEYFTMDFLLRSYSHIQTNSKNSRGETALILAAMFNKIEEAKLLLSKGADINQSDDYGDTPLKIAVQRGHGRFVSMLLRAGADVNLGSQTTPIQDAKQGLKIYENIIKLLKYAGAEE
jgi:ankyrin repeat protein